MGNKLIRWVLLGLRPLVRGIGFALSPIYNVLFSSYDRKLARRDEAQLANDIQRFVPFIFLEKSARIIPTEGVPFPLPFDYAIVTVEFSNLQMRITRGRDDLAAQIAPDFAPKKLHELSTILWVLEVSGIQRGSIINLLQVDKLLSNHIDEIEKAFSAQEYPKTRARLDEVYQRDEIIRKQLQVEINRNPYG
jgi:hypothetical protein